MAQRVIDGQLPLLAAGGGQHGFDRAFAAIGHWHAYGVSAGAGGFDAARNGCRRIGRGNACFERVGSDNDFHGFDWPGCRVV
ncbi:hypothetical protein G6F24_018234 [Rhizopus arrhizus]|nr:hypothetical protein G6F24_018234 [Rhizopus arrhizus]